MCCHGGQWVNICAKARTKVNKMIQQWKFTTDAHLTCSLPTLFWSVLQEEQRVFHF